MPAPDYAVEIAALEAAAASGELTVESDGDRVTYRSTSDLLKMLDYFRTKASTASPTPPSLATLAVFEGD
ncbi:hypothetical protein BBAL3_2301 [Brevundimonas sp. BAL3]|uniref:phage head-tail joining protein n=1 Tax=Brevundimonas sp. BAL3 TaxID=391600 RepID=UPI00017ED50A|nr:hypothetical protein [Brevundimonas sp. BAL3]EDX81144.1 hypothetical protein BBAL3_2301 [Brevundimonas sp. BAL3]